MRDRTDEFLSYAHRFPLGDPRQLLGLALRDAYPADLAALAEKDRDRAALSVVARVSYALSRGGMSALRAEFPPAQHELCVTLLTHAGAHAAATALRHLDGTALTTPIESECHALLANFAAIEGGDGGFAVAFKDMDFGQVTLIAERQLKEGTLSEPLLEALCRSLDTHDVETVRERACALASVGFNKRTHPTLVKKLEAAPARWAPLIAPMLTTASSDDASLAHLVARVMAVSAQTALVVLRAIAAVVGDPYGEFTMRKPAGLRPDLPLFGVVEAALRHEAEPVRQMARTISGPWTWSADELNTAITESRADERPTEELAALERYVVTP